MMENYKNGCNGKKLNDNDEDADVYVKHVQIVEEMCVKYHKKYLTTSEINV